MATNQPKHSLVVSRAPARAAAPLPPKCCDASARGPSGSREGSLGHQRSDSSLGHQRSDGRQAEEMRPMFMGVGSLRTASGSAYVSQGDTRINCAIYGPKSRSRKTGSHTAGRAEILLDLKVVPFAKKYPSSAGEGSTSNAHTSESEEGRTAVYLQQALESVVRLEQYPKSYFDVCVLVLDDDGGILSAALTCISLALADAGVETVDLIAAASVYAVPRPLSQTGGKARSQDLCLVDLSSSEIEHYRQEGGLTELHLGFCAGRAAACLLLAVGPDIDEQLEERLLNLAESACRPIGEECRQCVKDGYRQKVGLQMAEDEEDKGRGPEGGDGG